MWMMVGGARVVEVVGMILLGVRVDFLLVGLTVVVVVVVVDTSVIVGGMDDTTEGGHCGTVR